MAKALVAPPGSPAVPPATRTTISDQQIAQAAYDAGFRGTGLTTAIAVAIAESHGNTTALNDHGEFSVGLWQINLHGYLANRLTQWHLQSWTDLWNPETNAAAAFKLSGGGTHFGLWSTYKDGHYKQYMNRASAAAATVNPSGSGNPSPNPVPVGFNPFDPTSLLGLTNPGAYQQGPDIFQSISHAFIFGVIILIGLVVLMVSFKVKPQGGSQD